MLLPLLAIDGLPRVSPADESFGLALAARSERARSLAPRRARAELDGDSNGNGNNDNRRGQAVAPVTAHYSSLEVTPCWLDLGGGASKSSGRRRASVTYLLRLARIIIRRPVQQMDPLCVEARALSASRAPS